MLPSTSVRISRPSVLCATLANNLIGEIGSLKTGIPFYHRLCVKSHLICLHRVHDGVNTYTRPFVVRSLGFISVFFLSSEVYLGVKLNSIVYDQSVLVKNGYGTIVAG